MYVFMQCDMYRFCCDKYKFFLTNLLTVLGRSLTNSGPKEKDISKNRHIDDLQISYVRILETRQYVQATKIRLKIKLKAHFTIQKSIFIWFLLSSLWMKSSSALIRVSDTFLRCCLLCCTRRF